MRKFMLIVKSRLLEQGDYWEIEKISPKRKNVLSRDIREAIQFEIEANTRREIITSDNVGILYDFNMFRSKHEAIDHYAMHGDDNFTIRYTTNHGR